LEKQGWSKCRGPVRQGQLLPAGDAVYYRDLDIGCNLTQINNMNYHLEVALD
jgi:hypothetical protein